MTAKSILITGCSSGIGLDSAIMLKQRGYRVFATARKMADVERLKSMGFESIQLDVNDSASIKQALEQVLQLTGGTLYGLFNNAGFLIAGAIEDLSLDMMRSQFETNVFGPMELTRQVLPIMRKQGYGRIIQNSSIMGVMAAPFVGNYTASKFALEGFSNTLRQELRGTPIHISILNPGPIASKLRDSAFDIYQKNLLTQQTGVYEKDYKKLEEFYFKPKDKELKFTVGSEALVKCLVHALESPRPKIRYFVGFPAKMLAFLKRILPESAMDWIFTSQR